MLPSFSFSCNRLLFMLRKSLQVKEQLPALISGLDFPVDLTVDNMHACGCKQTNVSEGLFQSSRLTAIQRDAGASVRGQNVAAVTATHEAADGVHTLMVAHVAAWLFTLIDVCVFQREGKI